MPEDVARADACWLALREPADAAARATSLVEDLRTHLPDGPLTIHDLGCGTGSMRRWLAPLLPGPQRWIGYDRDALLVADAGDTPPSLSSDGTGVTSEVRLADITRLSAAELAGASLITASALLDMLTGEEIERLAASVVAAGCPALISLSVVGQVELSPVHPLDRRIMAAFNDHQRRAIGPGRLAGPDAVELMARTLERAGCTVRTAPSPWVLDPTRPGLLRAWLEGWVGAACEQEPSLRESARDYLEGRSAHVETGGLTATVHHRDLLAIRGAGDPAGRPAGS